MVLRTTARYYSLVGDRIGWANTVSEALNIANQAGLIHQYDSMMAEYGMVGIPVSKIEVLRDRMMTGG